MHILIIDNNDSFTYNLKQLIASFPTVQVEVVTYTELDAKIVEKFDKIVISPGPGLPEDYPKYQELFKLFEKKSVLGICMGYEIIATHYGAKLEQLESVRHGLQKEILPKDGEILFSGIKSPAMVGFYHSWFIAKDSIPEILITTAIDRNEQAMAIRHLDYDIQGLQFHPESYMTEIGRDIIENWLYQ